MKLEKRSPTPDLEIGDGFTFIREDGLHATQIHIGDVVERAFDGRPGIYRFRVAAVYGNSACETVFLGIFDPPLPDEPEAAPKDPRTPGPDLSDALSLTFAAAAA